MTPSPPVKLIATDMDGTLLAPDHRLSSRTLSAIDAARQAGIEVLPVTGRGFRSAVKILEPARLETAICSNGALIYDLAGDRIAETRPIAGDDVRSVVAHLRERMPAAIFGWETTVAASFEDGFHRNPPHGGSASGVSTHEPLHEVRSAIKLFLAHPEIVESDLQHAVQPLLFPGMNVSTSGAPFVEVTAAGVDKATTLARVAAARGFRRSEVMAFGDQMNDLAMLQWAGVGVAMGNARPEAKAVADEVTASNSEDGVALLIEKLLG
ncbi:MAG: Cof-type HAD-IIB family hydrolase [Acidimicrobiales bacterium]